MAVQEDGNVMSESLPLNRCTGHCCENFSLPWDQAGIDKALADTLAGTKVWQDIEFVHDMVIFIGPIEESHLVNLENADNGQKFWAWTCRHYDRENRICTVYDKRPQMCRKHGVDYPCATNGCTFKGARRDPELLAEKP